MVEQLKSIACNPFGFVIKDPLPEHPEFEEITARKPSSTPLSKAWKDFEENKGLLRSDMSLTAEEIGNPETGDERYMIVGYAFLIVIPTA
ncbi:hypothetical protein CLAIMM_03742 [Cladophialophora immunda]|nr:hypothetical protein CLAIMM_03742 [Cladophialophora immunda]